MTDKQKNRFINARRRGFLQSAAVAGSVVASGAAVSDDVLEQTVQPSEDKPAGSKGYERTEHVSRYYARARF